ncbi:hypothetical protein HPP92_012850 [Vanilla planifolia]|uniref:Uncharacterized protein n=1 Tax=Vanilla planifolia TaxID=51239 RepID=A0A835QR96_VANPL|nr:hypothetical protein HPP92_012850 [Vanilla planifolia]
MSLPPPMLLSCRSKLRNGGASGEQQLSQSKSTCSTASDTSKGSVLSLSRREIGSKAKELSQEKAAKEKENDSQHQNMNNQSSFTDLLTAGGGGDGVADCFGQGGFFNYTFRVPTYPSLLQLESNPNMAMGMMAYNASSVGEHQEMQHFSFLQDHVLPVAAAATTGDYDLNVSISSSFAGINRGTLQSNSPHQHHLVDGTNLPFFIGAALPVGAAAGTSSENQLPLDSMVVSIFAVFILTLMGKGKVDFFSDPM